MPWTTLLAADPKTSLDATTIIVAAITAVFGSLAAYITTRGNRGQAPGATTKTLTDIIAELHDERDAQEARADKAEAHLRDLEHRADLGIGGEVLRLRHQLEEAEFRAAEATRPPGLRTRDTDLPPKEDL